MKNLTKKLSIFNAYTKFYFIKVLNFRAYKYVREISVTEQELIKTTTQKIKRHEEMKTLA